jgi:hypothetical protein
MPPQSLLSPAALGCFDAPVDRWMIRDRANGGGGFMEVHSTVLKRAADLEEINGYNKLND